MVVKLTDIVQAVAVVGMVVRPQDRVDMDHVGREQLRTHVR